MIDFPFLRLLILLRVSAFQKLLKTSGHLKSTFAPSHSFTLLELTIWCGLSSVMAPFTTEVSEVVQLFPFYYVAWCVEKDLKTPTLECGGMVSFGQIDNSNIKMAFMVVINQ